MTLPEEASEFLLYQTEDGQARIHVRLDGDTVWLTQAAPTLPDHAAGHHQAHYGDLRRGRARRGGNL